MERLDVDGGDGVTIETVRGYLVLDDVLRDWTCLVKYSSRAHVPVCCCARVVVAHVISKHGDWT